jgi:hypothetical protein
MLVKSIAETGDLMICFTNSPGIRVWASIAGGALSRRATRVTHPNISKRIVIAAK